MNRLFRLQAWWLPLVIAILFGCRGVNQQSNPTTVKFTSFNCSLSRPQQNQLQSDLSSPQDPQIKLVAEIIQTIRPEILILCEFDYDSLGRSLDLFEANYLGVSQNGQETIFYPQSKSFISNTGMPSGLDLDKDGTYDAPADSYGFGQFPGQYAFAVLSKYPFALTEMRSFQHFLWDDMPEFLAAVDTLGEAYYSDQVLSSFRLSSKNHVDLPVVIGDTTVHLLISHPTPPVFDGPEDLNGHRNFDEIRLWSDYISGGSQASYLYDDLAIQGGLGNQAFVVFGDLNADPYDGDSVDGAVAQLLDNPKIHRGVARGDLRPQVREAKKMLPTAPDRWEMKAATRNLILPGGASG
jgi:hypothetical protein